MSKTYTCVICSGINASAHHSCQHCGTIPAKYSILGKPARMIEGEYYTRFVEVTVAYGVERQNHTRTMRHSLRTVPADYYSEV